jgi:AcrR family transcriptional regulator
MPSKESDTTAVRRQGRNDPGKQAEKKRELALHTLSALAELGFARLNLRDVAMRSGASLGLIHYYFADKTDLLTYCIRLYKDDFVRQLEEVIDSAGSLDELISRFPAALAQAIEEHGRTHRLWYDVRAQALFDPAFQDVVAEIENRLIGVVEHFLSRVNASGTVKAPWDALSFYLMLDGWFRYFLHRHIGGDRHAGDALRKRLMEVLPSAEKP